MDNHIIPNKTTESKSQNGVTMFSHETFGKLRVVIKNQEPWFVAVDVCRALDVDSTQTRRLDDDEKGLHSIQTLGGVQQMSIISEPGLYALALGSKKPDAKLFKRWVYTVIKTLRQSSGLEGFEIFRMLDKRHQFAI